MKRILIKTYIVIVIFSVTVTGVCIAAKSKKSVEEETMVKSREEAQILIDKFFDEGYAYVSVNPTFWPADIDKGYKYEVSLRKDYD